MAPESKMRKIEVKIDSDGIMHVEYPCLSIVSIHDVQEEYRKRLDITNTKTPLLVKIHGVASFSEDAQKFLCSAGHCAITSAAAVIGDSNAGYFEHSKILVDLFKDLNKIPFDFKYFEDEESAITWLKTYL